MTLCRAKEAVLGQRPNYLPYLADERVEEQAEARKDVEAIDVSDGWRPEDCSTVRYGTVPSCLQLAQ